MTCVRTRICRGFAFVLVCLFLGCVSQALVAFGLAAFGPEQETGFSFSGFPAMRVFEGNLFEVYDRSVPPNETIHISLLGPARPADHQYQATVPAWAEYPTTQHSNMWTTRAFGWPLVSCCGSGPFYEDPSAPHAESSLMNFSWLPLHPLPTRPIGLSTLTNSAFYGVIVAGIWLIARTARRSWRRRYRVGVCAHCGYALAGLPAVAPCPECGGER